MTDLRVTQLSSGLTVATERIDNARSVATGAWVAVGARDEPDRLAGVAHFLEHLLFKGTTTRSARDISCSVDRVGGDLNAFTSKEYTAFYCRIPAAQRSFAVELLGDVVGSPTLRAEDIDAERQVILEELAMDDDDPDGVAHRLAVSSMFPGHPLGRDTAGERDTVRAMTRQDVVGFFATWYRAGSTVVSVAGPLDHDQVLDEASEAFAGLAPQGCRPVRDRPPATEAAVVVEEDDTEQVHLVLGWPGVGRTDADREALDVLSHVLGGGLSSRLFEQIRERRGLAYHVYSSTAAYVDAGMLSVYAGTTPTNLGQVRSIIEAEISSLLAHGIDDDELEVAIGSLTGGYEMGLEDTRTRMSRTGGLLVTTGDVLDVETQLARWRAVSRRDVQRVTERVLDGPRIIVAVGPVTSADLT